MNEGKKGSWIDFKMGRWIYAKCAVCETIQDVKSNYCPECGDRKNGGEENKMSRLEKLKEEKKMIEDDRSSK